MDAVLKPMLTDFDTNRQQGPRVASSTGARNLERGRGSLSLTAADNSGAGAERRTDGGVSYVVQFPGGPSCPPPRPSRLQGPVAHAAAERNAGTMASVLNADGNRDYQSPRRQPKQRSAAAEANASRFRGEMTAFCLNYDRNRGYWSAREPCVRGAVGKEALERSRGVMGGILNADNNADYAPPRPASRRKGVEAELNAQRCRGGEAIRHTLDVEANTGYQTARPPSHAVTAEARDNAARFDGQEVSQLISNTNLETMLQPEPRVKPEARDAAMKNRGTWSLAYDDQLVSYPPDVRVKGSGKDNYDRGRHGSMNQLLSGNGHLAVSERPPSRIRDEGAENLQNGQTGTVHKLFHSYGQMPRSPRPAARVRPEAGQNAIRNMGTMSDFL